MTNNFKDLKIPEVKDYTAIPKGDMPGDKIEINSEHVEKAKTIFAELKKHISAESESKVVLSVHGGSGVGKSEIASLLAYILGENKVKSYILSGDNYPRRIPKDNDYERLRIFREHALKGLIREGRYNGEIKKELENLVESNKDFDSELIEEYGWLETYQQYGRRALDDYLGTPIEIDFNELSDIIDRFKNKQNNIFLKRMGRIENETWYDSVDFTDIDVLIIEWTHGNSRYLKGVDIPILLKSTPQETLEHRRKRNRDGGIDSPFTMMVLEIEQNKIFEQSHRAKIIITKDGRIIDKNELDRITNV